METPDIKLYKEVFACVDEYTGLKDCHNARYQFLNYPQRLYVLSEMIKLHVLRESGNIKKFLSMDEELCQNPNYHPNRSSRAVRKIMEWLAIEMAATRAPQTVSTRGKIVLSMLVWGPGYTEKMLERTFKSLMAEGNLPYLTSCRYVIIHLQTDLATQGLIEASPIVQRMKEIGVNFEYSIFPSELVADLGAESIKWWMVGAAASLAIHYAKRSNAAFHHSYPDIIYSNKYFTELVRLSKTHNSILGQAYRADESLLLPNLETYDDEQKIDVPSADLAALHLNSMHAGMFSLLVNNRPRFWTYPQSHVMIWEGQENLHFNCPHLNIMWLEPHVLKGIPDRYFMTLDSEIDLLCLGDDFYIPQEVDEIYLVEFSEQCKGVVEDIYVDAHACGRWMWDRITHRDVFKFFVRGMKVKINRTLRPMPTNAMAENQIAAEKNYLFNAMMATDPHMGVRLARPRTHEGRIFAFI